MSPPQQQPSVTDAEKTVPSSSTVHSSSVTVTPSVTVPVVPTLPSPATEAITTEAEQNLPTPMTENVTASSSALVPVPGSGSMEDIVIEVEQKLTPITPAPAPVTAIPSVDVPVVLSSVAAPVNDPPPVAVRERLSPAMAIKIEIMIKLTSYMWKVPLVIFLLSILFLKASKTVDNIIFYTSSSLMCFWSIRLTGLCFKTLDVNIPCWFFHFIMLCWNLTFIVGFCSLVVAFYYLGSMPFQG